MAEGRARSSSFSRNPKVASTALNPGLKPGPNGTIFISSGIPDLDKILGSGFCLGSLVMVMEDPEAPHHMLLLRNFMAQGLIHNQPLLYASPSKDPRGFLGTLPSPLVSKDDKSRTHGTEQDKNLRIAWQYKKYFDGNQQTLESRDMVSSKHLKNVLKGKSGSSSRTMSEAVSPGKEAKRQTASPDRSKEIAVAPLPEKSPKEGRMKRKQDPSVQQKEAKKKKIAEVVEVQQAAEELHERQETAHTAMVSSSARTNAFMARCPSSSDLRLLAIPPSACVEEKKWLASLPADALHYETSKYFEMARLGYHATVAYCGALEAKCRSLEGTPMHQSQLTIAQELVHKVQTERDQLQKEKEELLKTLEAKENIISAHEIALEERGKIISGKNKDLKTADKLLNNFKEKLQSLRAESKTREGEWSAKEQEWNVKEQALSQRISEGEQKLRDIYKSVDFKAKVGESILPHWQQGMRIGVRQAVKTFGSLDPKIAYFEPDYEDACGEPDIEDSDEEVESKEDKDPSTINEAMDED